MKRRLIHRVADAVREWLWSWSADMDCDWDADGRDLIGQADDGLWYGPTGEDRWTRLRWSNPRHVAAFWRSRRRKAAVFLEVAAQ